AMILGILSPFLLFLCGIGVLTAIIGLILGIIAVVRNANRGRAWVGVALSALTIVLAAAASIWFFSNFGECMHAPTEGPARRCADERLGRPAAPRWGSGRSRPRHPREPPSATADPPHASDPPRLGSRWAHAAAPRPAARYDAAMTAVGDAVRSI